MRRKGAHVRGSKTRAAGGDTVCRPAGHDVTAFGHSSDVLDAAAAVMNAPENVHLPELPGAATTQHHKPGG